MTLNTLQDIVDDITKSENITKSESIALSPTSEAIKIIATELIKTKKMLGL